MKSNIFLFIIFFVLLQNFYGQNIVFTKGVGHTKKNGMGIYAEYTVNDTIYKTTATNVYRIINWGNFYHKGFVSFLVGYDSLHPGKGVVYYNKPFFDYAKNQFNVIITTAKIISINNYSCVYHFILKNSNDKIIAGSQIITDEDKKIYNIKPGSSFTVKYADTNPHASIILFDSPDSTSYSTSTINWNNPVLSKPNGISLELSSNLIFWNAKTLNQYLRNYSQPQISNVAPSLNFDISRYYKSGVWWGFGAGGGHNFSEGKIGLGYLQKITRRLYISASSYLCTMRYNLSSFDNEQVKIRADTSDLYYSSVYFNPKIDFLWRVGKTDGIGGCSFIKIGVGIFCNLNSDKRWIYEIGHASPYVVKNKSRATWYYFSGNQINMPTLSNNIFYISISYSLNRIKDP